MSARTKRCRAWARYFNRYGHIPGVIVGGAAAADSIPVARSWGYIRAQQAHRFGRGYAHV